MPPLSSAKAAANQRNSRTHNAHVMDMRQHGAWKSNAWCVSETSFCTRTACRSRPCGAYKKAAPRRGTDSCEGASGNYFPRALLCTALTMRTPPSKRRAPCPPPQAVKHHCFRMLFAQSTSATGGLSEASQRTLEASGIVMFQSSDRPGPAEKTNHISN